MALATNPTIGSDRELTINRTFNAPPALIFKMWTQPEHIARWWGCTTCRSVDVRADARPGGAFEAVMTLADGTVHTIFGTFKEVREFTHLAFTWSWRRDDGSRGSDTVVTVDLAKDGDKTALTLHQAVFDEPDECSGHIEGWTASLDRLVECLAGN